MRLADDLLQPEVPNGAPSRHAQPVHGSGVPDLRMMVPSICPGCPHAASYYALRVAERRLGELEVKVYGDLICPNCGGRGSLSSNQVAPHVDRREGTPFVAVVGSPTFLHTRGVGAIAADVRRRGGAVLVLDNELTGAMRRSKEIAMALGVGEVRVASPFNLDGMVDAILGSFKTGYPSVVLSRQPCHVLEAKEGKISKFASTRRFQVDESCTGCKHCVLQLGCPALETFGDVVRVDYSACVGCGVCASVCPNGSIREAEP